MTPLSGKGQTTVAVPPLVNQRACASPDCAEVYASPHGGRWPVRYCSPECHQADKRRGAAALGKTSGRALAVVPAQRAAVRGRVCLVCAEEPAEPAHLIDRSLAADDGDPRAVVPIGRHCHRLYDTGRLDLLPYLEPRFREQLAYAVERHGLVRTLERVTNQRWTTTGDPA